jgi:hypothetical protein
MTLRGWVVAAGAAMVFLAVGWWSFRRGWETPAELEAPAMTKPRSIAAPVRSKPELSPEQRRRILLNSEEARLADELNLPGNDIRQDLAIVASLFAAWRSNYPGQGNPFGQNREITEKLLGRNPNGLIFLREGNRAINREGELCDRWGTPFSFHAETGTRMEIRSAGPDRRLWTADDIAIVP